jgi:hypothetical protein
VPRTYDPEFRRRGWPGWRSARGCGLTPPPNHPAGSTPQLCKAEARALLDGVRRSASPTVMPRRPTEPFGDQQRKRCAASSATVWTARSPGHIGSGWTRRADACPATACCSTGPWTPSPRRSVRRLWQRFPLWTLLSGAGYTTAPAAPADIGHCRSRPVPRGHSDRVEPQRISLPVNDGRPPSHAAAAHTE